MELWTAFVLGLVGSSHCAGMCGPLAIALPGTARGWPSLLGGRVAYNLGRVVTYALLGAGFGIVGRTFALAGFQRWLSLIAGGAILFTALASSRYALGLPIVSAAGWLKAGFSKLIHRRTLASLLVLGMLNGLLPCGLVYVAAAGATATGGILSAIEYMIAFGVGTVPMMLALTLAGPKLPIRWRFQLQKLVPICLALVGLLLVLRGLSLGIPYLSPDLSGSHGGTPVCH